MIFELNPVFDNPASVQVQRSQNPDLRPLPPRPPDRLRNFASEEGSLHDACRNILEKHVLHRVLEVTLVVVVVVVVCTAEPKQLRKPT